MAKKKEKEFKILEAPLPLNQSEKKITRIAWAGINYRNTKDSGEISSEKNISSNGAPYLIPSEKREEILQLNPHKADSDTKSSTLSDIYGYGDMIIVAHEREYTNVSTTSYVSYHGGYTVADARERSILGSGEFSDGVSDQKPVSHQTGAGITAFTALYDYKNIAEINALERFLFFPYSGSLKLGPLVEMEVQRSVAERGLTENEVCEKWLNNRGNVEYQYLFAQIENEYKYYYYDEDEKTWTKSDKYFIPIEAAEITGAPRMRHVCIAHQRLFGIDENRVFASGYNDYANWSLDTADDYSPENAWVSSVIAPRGMKNPNIGIVCYSGSVFIFKNNSTFEITNTKNPFRVREIFSMGALSQNAVQVIERYLIFVNESGVYLYNGSTLKNIGYDLNVDTFYTAVTGSDGRKFYLYCKTDKKDKNFFVYDTYTGFWSEEDADTEFAGFCKNDVGMFGISDDFKIFRLDTGDYDHEWFAETDLTCGKSVDIKHIVKLQLLADIGAGSELSVYLLYDDEEFDKTKSHLVFKKENTGEKEIKLPIRAIPRKTAHYGFKIRIEGRGYSKIYQTETITTQGGEKYVEG